MPNRPTSGAHRPWGIVAVLALGTVALWWQPWSSSSVKAAAPPAPAAPMAVTAAPAAPPMTATAPAAGPRRPAITLVGTSVGGTGSFATVRTAADAPVQLLRVGDRIEGFTVTAVEAQRLVLSSPEQTAVVIDVDRAARAPVAPPGLSTAPRAPASPPAEQRAFADGEAPWDAGPNFRH